MRYHGVYPKIAVVIYLNEKNLCQRFGDWGYPIFKTLRSSALRCCQLQQLKSIRPVSGHDACGALAISGFIIFIYRSEFFEAKVTWHILNLCFLFFSLDSLTFREATYSQRRFQLE